MTASVGVNAPRRSRLARVLWYRQLDHYPDTGPRVLFLGIVVMATILLYYELYVGGAVSPSILANYGMSFRYYVLITVAANAVGAFSSLIAGIADRWGRANLVAYGLGITGLLVLVGIPNAHAKVAFALIIIAIGFVEGIILVATPALVRDFSPQMGRASAMGFWTLGPVVGSLMVSEVSSHTLSHLHAWQDQFIICGAIGLGVFVIALFGLRELSPNLRDQLMVSKRDRALIEARANGVDIEASLRHPWRQMLHFDIAGSAFAIAAFLIFYYTAVGFFTIYFTSIFHFSLAQANGIGNWFWAVDAITLVVVGLVSDKLKVRKPFMVVGAVGAIVMTIVFLSRATHPNTGYYSFAAIIAILSGFMAIAYAPWMAAFTETVEKRNPALTATGLAVWGWTIRAVIAVSIFILPYVVSSTNPLVDYGTQVETISAQYAPQLKTLSAVDPATLHLLLHNPANATAGATAIGEIVKTLKVSPGQAIVDLKAAATVPKRDLLYLQAHGGAVQHAAKVTPKQWQHWWWVCVAGELVFLPLIFLTVGRWRPRRARQDAKDHDDALDHELADLESEQKVPVGAGV